MRLQNRTLRNNIEKYDSIKLKHNYTTKLGKYYLFINNEFHTCYILKIYI